jgi:hypothetical protein
MTRPERGFLWVVAATVALTVLTLLLATACRPPEHPTATTTTIATPTVPQHPEPTTTPRG